MGANKSWNEGNKAAQQNKPLPNLNKMTPTQKTQTQLGYAAGSKKKS
jgi:hypothetical protein